MLRVKKLHPNAKLPTIAHRGEDLGYDLYALEDAVLYPYKVNRIKTGIAAQAFTRDTQSPLGLLIRDRSSMGGKEIIVTGGVCDHGYTGEIKVSLLLLNPNNGAYRIAAGDKIAQMIPIPVLADIVVEVDELDQSARGANGFGSTGMK